MAMSHNHLYAIVVDGDVMFTTNDLVQAEDYIARLRKRGISADIIPA